jgi:hypothetical protein
MKSVKVKSYERNKKDTKKLIEIRHWEDTDDYDDEEGEPLYKTYSEKKVMTKKEFDNYVALALEYEAHLQKES